MNELKIEIIKENGSILKAAKKIKKTKQWLYQLLKKSVENYTTGNCMLIKKIVSESYYSKWLDNALCCIRKKRGG